jgi:hypothetical protein
MPHTQSRASLLALQENLRQEAMSRKRALADLDLKKEFEALRRRHEERKKISKDRQADQRAAPALNPG